MPEKDRLRILIFAQWFTPAHKAGGPIRSIQNLVDLLGDHADVFVYSGDRDLGDEHPFENVKLNEWTRVNDHLSVIYNEPKHNNKRFILDTVALINPDVIYLNSMYAFKYSIMPMRTLIRNNFKGKIILAPRGMLRQSAIRFKSTKKKLFLYWLKNSGLLKNVFFHATDKTEAIDIHRQLKVAPQNIFIIDNPGVVINDRVDIKKTPGLLRLIFVGRIHPIKGLDILIDSLMEVSSKIELKVIGWIEKEDYYIKCLDKIKGLPSNIKVNFLGDLSFKDLMSKVRNSHLLALPTHGENFGHSIFEALSLGKPVIISDQTPWTDLTTHGVGWDLSLDDIKGFANAIEKSAAMNQEEYNEFSRRAFASAKDYVRNSHIKEKYLAMFGGLTS